MKARTRRLGAALSLTAAALAAAVVPAFAHATFDVVSVPADSDVELTIRAPLEHDDTNERIEAKFPADFDVDDCSGPATWLCDIESVSDGTVVTWQALTPTENDTTFRVDARTPSTPGDRSIPVVQTYSDGTEAAWIGPPGSDEPAPVLSVTGEDEAPTENTAPPASHSDDEPADEPSQQPSPTPTASASQAPVETSDPEPSPTPEPSQDGTTGPTPDDTAEPVEATTSTHDETEEADDASPAPAVAAADDEGDGADTALSVVPSAEDDGGNGALGLVALGLLLTAAGGAAWWWRAQQD